MKTIIIIAVIVFLAISAVFTYALARTAKVSDERMQAIYKNMDEKKNNK